MPSRYAVVLLISLTVGVATALGCGAEQPVGSPSAGDAQAGPKYGGTLSIPLALDPWDWDLSSDGKTSPNGMSQAIAYNSLLGFKIGPDVKYDDAILQPELAEKWEVSADARTYTFQLRKGVKFANQPPVNGRELTAADVVWSFEYWSRSGQFKDKKLVPSFLAPRFEGVDKIEATDPSTVVVRFKDPFVPFLTYAASDWVPVVAHEIYDLDGHLKDHIVGTGSFQLDRAASQKGSRWVWQKNPTHWDTGKPYLDAVRWLVIPDQSTITAAFVSKQIDVVPSIRESAMMEDLQRGVAEAVVHKVQAVTAGCAYINVEAAPLNNLDVRRALLMAIDRDEISQTMYRSKQPWAPPGAFSGLFTDAEARQILKYDPAESKRLLAQAGFPNGVDLEYQVSVETSTKQPELVQAQLKKAGFNLTLKPLTKVEYTDVRKAGKYQLQYAGDGGGGNCGNLTDEMDSIYLVYHSKSPINLSRVNDPDLDKMLVAQRQEANVEKRRELQRQAVRRIADQAYSYSMVYPPQWDVWRPYVKGHAPNAGIPFPAWGTTWLDK